MTAVLVIGLGNRHCGDDAVGPLVAEALGPEIDSLGQDIELSIGRHDAMDLANAWRDREVVHVIDAFRSSEEPGSIRRIAVDKHTDLSDLRQAASTHALGLREAIDLAATLDTLPRSLVLWGICGAAFDIDAPLTPAVRQALPELLRRVLAELDGVPTLPGVQKITTAPN